MVTQDTSLLHRSIRDNIAYGRPDATDAQIHSAAANAQADEFISQLSDRQGHTGYDTLVGERGIKLSGGQRQRVAIARVMLKNAPILVLDKPPANLDAATAAALLTAIRAAAQGRTTLIATHSEAVAAVADQVVRL